jgi:glycine/D-amino acid oxidase-like deaminating enzyme/nitrite reductase/ring-hydroxylating ferredoxin subunit
VAQGGKSFWIGTTPDTDYPALSSDVSVDVAVVGAGITGITTAVLLKQAGKTVALLDSTRIVRGATGYTTGKVTAGHGAVYSPLTKSFGEDGARTYAESNQAAIERIADLAKEHGIDCDFERKANYVVAEQEEEREQLKAEAETMKRLGLPAEFVTETPLPYGVAGAVRLDNQAQFHPRKYLLGLAATIPGDGSHVFENTRATFVNRADAGACVVETDVGNLRADDVVLATQLPFMDRGLFFTKAHPHRSYAVAAPIDPGKAPDGMFINAGIPTRSVRTLKDGDRLYIQTGGQGHKPGAAGDEPERYDILEAFLREHWPDAGAVEYRWSTQDYMPVDRVPYVGRLRRGSKHVFVATGYQKWGMTNGTVAAEILTDTITGRLNAWASLYDSKRIHARASAGKFVKENSSAGLLFFTQRLRRGEKRDPDDLTPGEGAILRVGGLKRAVYKDEGGEVHVLSPVCRHLWCYVEWNEADRSWDCPCHGSRYTGEGRVIQGPTVQDLRRVEP